MPDGTTLVMLEGVWALFGMLLWALCAVAKPRRRSGPYVMLMQGIAPRVACTTHTAHPAADAPSATG
jgi:hypothetical protein